MRSFFRVIRFAVQSVLRNFWLSFVTTSVFVLTLVTVNAVIFLNVLGNAAVKSVEDRVRVTVYFYPETSEEVTNGVRGYLLGLSQVKTVDYVTATEALEIFKKSHTYDANILAALDAIDTNPFGPAINISANSPEDYAFILTAIESPEYSPYIKDKDYADYADVLTRLSAFSERVRYAGFGLAMFFAFIAVLIAFNTIRVAIYVHREEIGVMKLVGAGDWFVRGPFLLESIIYSIVAVLFMMGITVLVLSTAGPVMQAYFVGIDVDLAGYYREHGLAIFGSQFIALSVLGLATTWFAMRKYLRV